MNVMSFFSPRSPSPGTRLITLAVLLCIGLGVGWMLWRRLSDHKITGQELLREAVLEWKKAGEPGYGPPPEIFQQQAGQGYYDDAAATARLFKRADDVHWYEVELARIRAENGDIQGAKRWATSLAGPEVRAKATEVIALGQAQRGDLPGALDTIAPLGQSDEVYLRFGDYQIQKGDFEGALDTAQQTKSGDQLFYAIGDALRVRGEQNRARKLAAQMKDRKLAALFLDCARFTLWPSPVEVRTIQLAPCEYASHFAALGRFAEADAVIQKNKCSDVSSVVGRQYAVDPSEAEKLLRANADKEDLVRGLNELANAAAEKGNISDALRFIEEVEHLSGSSTVSIQLRDIARAWTIRDGPKVVLKWTRSRPTTEQRTWALIGMAEALGHATPRR